MTQNEYKPHKAAVKGISGMLKAIIKPKKKKEKKE
jgi:hypothetical protein